MNITVKFRGKKFIKKNVTLKWSKASINIFIIFSKIDNLSVCFDNIDSLEYHQNEFPRLNVEPRIYIVCTFYDYEYLPY